MNELETLRGEVLAMYPTVLAELGDDLGGTRRALLDDSRARLADSRYHVVVCGEFRRGKSSLLNALVERKALFPVDVDVTTSVVCSLEWGEDERAAVHFAPTDPDDPASAPEPLEIALDELAGFVTEQANPDNRRNVVRAVARAPVDRLRSGMVLVDTPGVGSLNAAHTAATLAFLPHADAILFVCSAAQPLGTVELEFLDVAMEHCPIVLTAVTMMDKVVAPGPLVAEVRGRIATATGVPVEQLRVVGVSAHRKRKALQVGDQAMIEASGFPALERELWDGLAVSCGAARLGAALDALDAALSDVESPLLNELAALENDAELARVDAELRETQAKLAELKSGSSKWRRSLSEELEVSSRPARDGLTTAFEAIRERFKAEVAGPEALTDPNAIVNRTSAAMVQAVNTANNLLASVVADVADRYTRTTSVELTASGVPTRGLDVRIDEVEQREVGTAHWFDRFRGGWNGGSALGGAGTLVAAAAAVLFPVGSLTVLGVGVAATVIGWFTGSRRKAELERARQEKTQRQQLREQVLPAIDSAKRQAERDFRDSLHDVRSALTTALDDQLSATTDSLAQSVARLQANRRKTAAERATRRTELEAQQQHYAVLHTALDGLRARGTELVTGRRSA